MDLLEIVGALHEGVSDPAAWTRALTGLAEATGGPAVMTGTIGPPTHSIELEGLGVPDAAVAMMAGPLGNPADNPYLAALGRLPLRAPVGHDAVGGQATIEASRLWRDVMRPFGLTRSTGIVLDRLPGRTDFMMLGRTDRQGDFDAPALALLSTLTPHIARAFRVRRELVAMRALAADCMAALDAVDRGIVLAAEDGAIVHANRAAEAIFAERDGLDATRAGISTGRRTVDDDLRRLVGTAARTGVGRAAVAVGAMPVARRSARSSYTVVGEPLSPAHRERLGAPPRAGAVLFVGGGTARRRVGPAVLRALYGLSPAEARVAAAAADGAGATEVAAQTGLSVNTVKSHLKAAFAKIGVATTARLVARIAVDART